MPPETRYARNGDVSIAYETFGDVVSGVPLLLITGLDFQMVWWPDAFCEQLAACGFGVARFDNRDSGLSTHFSSARRQSPWSALMGLSKPAYTTLDMLDDALAVIDALAWPNANVMGGSMGAGLAQALALIHPTRVRALVSCMGIPADASPLRSLTYIKFPVFLKLRKLGTPSDREGEIELLVSVFRAIASPGFPFPEDWARATAAISHDRSPRDPTSTQRQLAAGRAQKLPPLSHITAPTLVISGRHDPLIKTKGGRDTARRIPGAQFVSYSGMGHNLPEELWPDVIEKISSIAGLKSPNPPGPADSRQPA
jgi:pimeloyl-ACP methyl ester carboxylesterase